jgi:hypothetical protein
VQGLDVNFGVKGSGYRFRVKDLWFRVQVLGFGVSGLGFMV